MTSEQPVAWMYTYPGAKPSVSLAKLHYETTWTETPLYVRPAPSPDVAGVADQLRKEAAMLREIARSRARGMDWRENLGASAEWLTQAAATITALSAELARKDKALEEARAFIADPAKHRYWGAGEPDCPREIKAGNGELHTLRCKVCGQDSPRDQICRGGFDAG